MNQNPGLIGTKIGNTQIFLEDGEACPVTVIQAGPCQLIEKRTIEQNGYTAFVLAFGEKREKLVSKAQQGYYKKHNTKTPRVVKEFRVSADTLAKFEVGDMLGAADLFTQGQFVDVRGTSIGRGFTGVMKRHDMRGAGKDTHGTHEYKRHGGAIGCRLTPGRTFKNMRMPGQYGNEATCNPNLRIAKIIEEQNLILVQGAVPGPRKGTITVRGSAKKKAPALPERKKPEVAAEAPAAA